jgi:pimeloyl-ACP methyl ester carboxylesterase
MKQSRSETLPIRQLAYHVRHWGREGAPKLFMLHGWMDVGASFQFVVDALQGDWHVIAPDWRGYGLTDWPTRYPGTDQYWFPDYLADLDFLLRHYSPDHPVNLVGHSLGGNVASLYCGVRPSRIARFVNLEGFGMRPYEASKAPERYADWMDELAKPPTLKPYASFDELAARMRKNNPRLSEEKAAFLARHWGGERNSQVEILGDPAHKIVNAQLYRIEEAFACWQRITAPVLFVGANQSEMIPRFVSRDEIDKRLAHVPTLRQAWVEGAGHMLHHDQPDEVARLIEAFLAE